MNNNITVNKKDSGTQFHFLNSTITLPDSPGLYAFDVACGSGKRRFKHTIANVM